jgi:hypothetical protein
MRSEGNDWWIGKEIETVGLIVFNMATELDNCLTFQLLQ